MRSMLFAVIILLVSAAGYAQDRDKGIYLTESDFEQSKLSYSASERKGKLRIKFNEFFKKPYITINENGDKKFIFKDEIFAYRNKKEVIRVWEQKPYVFVEKGPIWIYYRDFNFTRGKGYNTERQYFYSVSGTADIYPLSLNNLKQSFPPGHLYHDILQSNFTHDVQLALYHFAGGKFNINHLLETTMAVN